MAERKRNWIVAYDISDPRRLIRVCRFMKNFGMHVQNSVFFLTMTRSEIDTLIAELEERIHVGADDVRIYGCRSLDQVERLGPGYLEGDLWFSAGL